MNSTDTGLVYEVSFHLTYTGAGEFLPYHFDHSYSERYLLLYNEYRNHGNIED
jgi:hypothetical protein